MSDLEFFLIRTLPNKRRSLKVALRYWNRSKWRYQRVVKQLSITDASHEEMMLSTSRLVCESSGRVGESIPLRTLIAKKNNNSFLLAPSKEGVTYHLQLFNRRQCAVDEEIEIVRKDISHYQ